MQPTPSSVHRGEPARTRAHRRARGGARRLALLLAALLAGDSSAQAALRDQWRLDPVDERVPPTRAHFLVGNEARHDLFAPVIAGRGGAYLGVGGDQNYTLVAVSRASLVFLVDHDEKLVELHRELGRRIRAAADPASFLGGLEAPGDPPPAPLADVWPALVRHLRRVAARRQDGAPTTWLGDPVLYAILRDLWRRGAIYPVVGDLAGDTAMPSIAASAASRGVDFTVLYLSNVEETLAARDRLIDNLDALPRAADAVVLRTRSTAALPAADGLWSYAHEPLGELVARTRTAEGP